MGDPSQKPCSERELFLAALELAPGARAEYLARACGGDASLRQQAEALLRERDDVGSFLETPAIAPGGTIMLAPGRPSVSERPGERIGRYKLLERIGEGGCGVVYMAEQEEPVRRRVALKVIKLGMDTKSVIARFEAERQALAMMDHPNIAKVFDAGATETGRPFFVMELVRGLRVTEYCDENRLPTAERLRLFIQTTQAIQHAHQKGVIHRDIKPSNILITLHDGVPVPKVIDFGIAKATEQRLTDKTLFTHFQAFLGTPAYMSPEQAEMSGLDIDTRSDIYSLGVLLYEMLTGRTPFDAEELLRAGLDECRRTIREQEPVRPSTRVATLIESDRTTTANRHRTEAARLIHALRGDLDWIVMKCIEKDRKRRYETANALAMDIQRYLDNEPVLARPPSNLYRLEKMLRKHRGPFAAAAGIAIALLAGAGVSVWYAVRASDAEQEARSLQHQETGLRRRAEVQRERAEQGQESARLSAYIADINLANQSLKDGNLGRAVQLLNKHRPLGGERDLRGFEWRHLWQLCLGDAHESFPSHGGPVQSLTFDPKGGLFAVQADDQLSIWDVRTRVKLRELTRDLGPRKFGPGPRPPDGRPPDGRPRGPGSPGGGSMVFLPDGKTLVAAALGAVRVWNTADWSEQRSLRDSTGPITLSRDGSRLAALRDVPRRREFSEPRSGTVVVWNTQDWNELPALPGAWSPMAFSPDGSTLATDTEAGITLWPLDGAGTPRVLEGSTNVFAWGGFGHITSRTLAFSADGQYVVAARNTVSDRGVFVLSVWESGSGKEVASIPNDAEHIEHIGAIVCLDFSPDGRMLATASLDYSIRLWDFEKRERIAIFQGHRSEVWALAFSPDGQSIVSGAKGGEVKLWSTTPQPRQDLLPDASQPLAFSKDGRVLAAIAPDDAMVFINLATGGIENRLPLESARLRPASFALSADLGTLVQGSRDEPIRIWNTETGESDILNESSRRPVNLIALSPDGRILVTGGGRDPVLRWHDLRAGTNTLSSIEASRALFSPDGAILATLHRNNSVQLWDTSTRSLLRELVSESPAASFPFFIAAFSPDATILAVTHQDDTIQLWSVATGESLGVCAGHKQPIFSIAFSADGRTLASASADSTLKLWNVATQQELLTDRRLGGGLLSLIFSPDGQLLVGGSGFWSQSEGVRFYRAPSFEVIADLEARLPGLAQGGQPSENLP